MITYFSWVLRNRAAVVILCIVLSAAALASLSRAFVATTLGDMFFGNSPAYQSYVDHMRAFGSDEVMAIAYEDADPLSVESLDRLEKAIDAIKQVPGVARTSSLLTAQRVQTTPDGIRVETYAEAARANPEQRHALARELREDKQVGGAVIGRDGDRAAILIELTVNPDRSGEEVPAWVAAVFEAMVSAGYPPGTLHRAGLPAVISELLELTRFSMRTIFPVALVIMLILVTVLFRSPVPVLLAAVVSLLSVLWTLGAAATYSPKLNIFHGAVPAVVTVVAVSDVIHLWSAYLRNLELGLDRLDAVQSSAHDVGRACLLTSITTFVGFVSLSLVPTPIFQQLGWALGAGVAFALLLAMTLVPIAATVGGLPSTKTQRMDNPVARLVDGIVLYSARWSTRHPWRVIAMFAVMMATVIYGCSKASIETDFERRLDADNPIRRSSEAFRTHFTGTQLVDLYVDTDTPDGITDPAVIRSLAQLDERLEALPGVDEVLSLSDVLEEIHAKLGGEGPFPDSQAAIAQYLLLFELGGGEDIERVLDFERQGTRLALRLNERRMRATYDLGVEAELLARQLLPPGTRVEASGMNVLSGGWLDEIITGQKLGVAMSVLTITVLMCLGLRSAGVGLISMVPNLLPLLVLVGGAGLVWGEIDSDTMVVLMMAIGIGVDDTIHFLMRFRVESERTDDIAEAIQRTFDFAGRAIVMTTVILALGFLPFVMSDYYSTRIMGTLLPLALLVAMVADLLLVPALAQVGLLKFRQPSADT